MATIEDNVLLQKIDTEGNNKIIYPMTKLENVVGIENKADKDDLKTKMNLLKGSKLLYTDGWYRVAEFKNTGTYLIYLNQRWNHNSPCCFILAISIGSKDYNISILDSFDIQSTFYNSHIILNKFRIVQDEDGLNNPSYLEVYYHSPNADYGNEVSIQIINDGRPSGISALVGNFEKDIDENVVVKTEKEAKILHLDNEVDNINSTQRYKHYNNIHQVVDKTTYTVDTTFLDILKQIPSLSIVRYVTTETNLANSSVLCTNEVYNITGTQYNLIEIIKHDGSSEIIKIYNRDNGNGKIGYYTAQARSNDNYISNFSFVGRSNWINLTPQNGWEHYSTTNINHPKLSYCRENNTVRLRGVVKYPLNTTSNATIIATLPEGMRPNYTKMFACVLREGTANDTFCRVDVNSDGTIKFEPISGDNAKYTTISWVSLDNISYPLY